jgi:DNA-directed RNA polymerase subunit beta
MYYINIMAISKVVRSSFGAKLQSFPVPDVNQTQIESYKNFWRTELSKILEEFSPIEDSSGRWRVTLGPGFYLEPSNNETEIDVLLKGQSYNAPLYIDVKVENLITKETKKQKVFAGNMPLMTRKGDFVINGVQKIVVAQLVKAPGLLYTRDLDKGQFEYTAKVIPTRGIWVDFVIGADHVIYCRIDRKKKFPVTQLFKLFEMKDDEIIETFENVDNDPSISYIRQTLDKDTVYGVSEAVNSIYKKIRPGDICTIDKGLKHIKGLFTDPDKYDFGKVGRYKFDNRLRLESKTVGDNYKKTFDISEVVTVVKELIRMKIEIVQPDSIDSLSNRRVRSVGDWIANTFRSGLARVVRNSKDKMTISENTNFTPAQLVNMRPLSTMVDDFFNTSQLSRFMEQTNASAEMDQRQFMTCSGPGGLTRERASFDIRDVQESYYGRICPVNTPEGSAFGINLHMAIYSRVNHMGFLETPYLKIKKNISINDTEIISRTAFKDVIIDEKKVVKAGTLITADVREKLAETHPDLIIPVRVFVSKEIKWMGSDEELIYLIGEFTPKLDDQGHFLVDNIGARQGGNPVQASVHDVEFVDVTPNQIFSLSTCLLPFIAQTDGLRAAIGTNQQGQALPLVKPEVPYIATGYESIVARDSGYLITAEENGLVTSADALSVKYKGESGKEYSHRAMKFMISNDHTCINQRIKVKTGEKISKGDVLVEGFGIQDGEFAVGQNVLVAFLPFKGYNYEDAIILSERLVQKDKFTSNHIYELICDVHETRLGHEEITAEIPNAPTEKLKKLNSDGIIHLGSYVESGDILVGKITPKGEVDLTPEDKLIRVLFGEYSRDVKDSSLYLQHGLNGKVISVRVLSRDNGNILPNDVLKRVIIWLATTRKIKAGDKMAGRHGNKGVVSKVLPVEDMPYLEDGTPVDMILNPLSVISRMNLGQILETHLGLVCHKRNLHAITQPLNEISIQTIQNELVDAGYRSDGKLNMIDGQTGEMYDQPVTAGYIYYNKLYHLVDDKMHARSTGPYSLVTQQPLGGRSMSGGQRFGEMEVWALEAYGAAHALQEMLTIKSDDVKGRDAAFESIVREQPIFSPNLPNSFIVLANELTALGIKVNAEVVEAVDDYSKRFDSSLALSVDEGGLDK